MAIKPEPYNAIKPGLDLGLLAARRMGPASWLTVPEAETVKGDESVTKSEETQGPKPKRPYNRKPKAVEAVGGGMSGAKEETKSPITKAAEEQRSLLCFLEKPVVRPGLFIDFTGNEDLLAQVQALSNDLNHDLLCLLRGLLKGELGKMVDGPVGAED